MPVGPASCPRRRLLAGADHVAGGVADYRYPQISFGVGRLDNRATVLGDFRHDVVNAICSAISVCSALRKSIT